MIPLIGEGDEYGPRGVDSHPAFDGAVVVTSNVVASATIHGPK